MLRSRSGRATLGGATLVVLIILGWVCVGVAASISSPSPTASARASAKGEFNLTNLPLPIGQEAKGLVLPEFNLDGRLVGRVEAATARRTDQEHILFGGIKLVTFTEAGAADLQIEMSESVLNLKTRVVTSSRRTTVSRVDLTVAGDAFEFDTVSRLGKLTGNVKMVIIGKEHLARPQDEHANQ